MPLKDNVSEIAKAHVRAGEIGGVAYLKINHHGVITAIDDTLAMENVKALSHCFSDLRRFIENKWPGVADLPSMEAVLLSGPEWKHEVDAMIAALNRVADFYEENENSTNC